MAIQYIAFYRRPSALSAKREPSDASEKNFELSKREKTSEGDHEIEKQLTELESTLERYIGDRVILKTSSSFSAGSLFTDAIERHFAMLSEIDRSVLTLSCIYRLNEDQIAESMRAQPFEVWAKRIAAERRLQAELEIELTRQLALLRDLHEWHGIHRRIRSFLKQEGIVEFLLQTAHAARQTDPLSARHR
ncbi:MAG TPA: hypothetical protein VML57_17270 [Burkholderiales bacterium]|nr:hypothetical protein [Burkholderiales bacterium]